MAGRARQAFFTGSFLEGTLSLAGVPALDELAGVVSALGGMVFRVVRDGFLSEVCSEAVLGASGAFCKHRICCWIKVLLLHCSRCNSRTDSMSCSGMEADAFPAAPSVAGAFASQASHYAFRTMVFHLFLVNLLLRLWLEKCIGSMLYSFQGCSSHPRTQAFPG